MTTPARPSEGGGELVLPLPSRLDPEATRRSLAAGEWFYPFTFDNGVTTPCSPDLARIHDTRARLVLQALRDALGDDWSGVSALDVACHEGFFALQMAVRGADVLAFDIDPAHVEGARFITDLTGLPNLRYEVADVRGLEPSRYGHFEVVLFLGLLYHLDDPMGSLRLMRHLTRHLCIIETQVAQPAPEVLCEWGTGVPRQGPAVAVVPADEGHAHGSAIALVPTQDALTALLRAAGFEHVAHVPAQAGDHPQFVAGDRVVVVAR